MLTKSKRLLSFVLSAFMLMTAMCMENAVTADAVDVSSASAFDILEDMGTGWNLGNTLEATAATGLDAETSWGNPRTTQAMIDTVKAAGFNSVRIPVSWGIHTSGSDYTIDSAWMSRVKTVVDYCFNNDMYVILNIHHDTDKSYYYPTSEYLEQSKKYVGSVWTQIASEFKDYDEHLIFETLNEPRLVGTGDEWWFYRDYPNTAASDAISCINTLNQTAVDAIRGQGGKNSNRLIMCPGYCASIDGCTTPNFKLPTDTVSNRLVVSVHAYTPYNFALNANGTSTFSDDLKAEVDSLFEQINSKYLSQNIPVIIGEVSASNKNNKDERIKWVDYYYGKAKQYGVPCMLWDNNAYNNPSNAGEAHGHLNRSALSWYDPNFINEIMSVLGISGGASGAQIPDLSACQITTLFSGYAQVTQWGYSEELVIKNAAGTADYDMRELGKDDFICVKYSGATPGIAVQKTTQPQAWVIAEPVKAENGIAYFSQKTLASAYGAAYESSVGSAVPSDFYDIGQCYISSKEGTVYVTEILIASKAAAEPEVPAAAISQTYTSTGTDFTLNWAKADGVTGYNVYKYDGANSKWVLVKTVTGADTLSTTVSGFTPGSVIKFKVNAYITQNGNTYEGDTSNYLYAAALANAKISTNYTSTGTSYTLNW
ncbi:MAG: cellulase family glycosylhydrolase, partial [Oscillospiraceae bacterium]